MSYCHRCNDKLNENTCKTCGEEVELNNHQNLFMKIFPMSLFIVIVIVLICDGSKSKQYIRFIGKTLYDIMPASDSAKAMMGLKDLVIL